MDINETLSSYPVWGTVDSTTGGISFELPESSERKSWYSMRPFNNGESVEIRIYEDIYPFWGVDAKTFSDELDEKAKSATQIDLRIHSPGGDVFEGFAIYNILRKHQAKITVHVDGLAASIASVVAMAGDEIIMSENAYMMIHNPWGFVVGEAEELRRNAEILDKLTGTIAETYMRRDGVTMSAEEIRTVMANETWYTAEEAVEHGFADSISGPIEMAAVAHAGSFKNAPKGAKKLFTAKGPDPSRRVSIQKAAEKLKSSASAGNTETKEESPMSEELVSKLTGLVSSLEERIESFDERVEGLKAKVDEAVDEARQAREEAKSVSQNSLATLASTRLDALVRNGQISPPERDAYAALIEDEENEDRVKAFLAKLEKLPKARDRHLTQEITTPKGERRHVNVTKRHTTPAGAMPDPSALATLEAALEDAESFEDLRRNAYALEGELEALELGPLFGAN